MHIYLCEVQIQIYEIQTRHFQLYMESDHVKYGHFKGRLKCNVIFEIQVTQCQFQNSLSKELK